MWVIKMNKNKWVDEVGINFNWVYVFFFFLEYGDRILKMFVRYDKIKKKWESDRFFLCYVYM